MSYIKEFDSEVYNAIINEEKRQEEGIELIASENFVSKAVMEAAGSVFTNKYAEGYPEKRYYGSCRNADTVEQLAITDLKKYSVQSMQMFSLIQVLRQIWECMLHCLNREIQF